jgi:asparagine synthase (glutamine-hydrolysing)
MCGIAGFLQIKAGAGSDGIRPSGNDGGHQASRSRRRWLLCKKPVGLGMRRLSIVDLPGGAQPISNERGSVWTVFNGEIYNYEEIRKDLEAAGHTFQTKSDTEVWCMAMKNGAKVSWGA